VRVTTAENKAIFPGSVLNPVAEAVVADTAAVADMEADAGAAEEAATSNVTNVRDTATCPGSAPIDEIPSNGLQTKKFRLNLLSRYFNPRSLVGSIPS